MRSRPVQSDVCRSATPPSGDCLRGESPTYRMLATPWHPLCLAAFGLNLAVVAVLRDSRVVVAVLRGRLLYVV